MAKKIKKAPATTGANAVRTERVQELRRSGAHGSHDTRARGTRTRAGAKKAAIASGW